MNLQLIASGRLDCSVRSKELLVFVTLSQVLGFRHTVASLFLLVLLVCAGFQAHILGPL